MSATSTWLRWKRWRPPRRRAAGPALARTIADVSSTDAVNEREPTEAERLQKALSLALSQINRRERTVAELRAHLVRKGVAGATVEAAIAELVRERLVDDVRFTEMFVHDKRELQAWGSQRIRRGLIERGIDPELAERAVAAVGTDAPAATELERAVQLLRRRFPEPPRDRRDRDRALGMLLRKGYASEISLDALAARARDV
jgi:regulatory protein